MQAVLLALLPCWCPSTTDSLLQRTRRPYKRHIKEKISGFFSCLHYKEEADVNVNEYQATHSNSNANVMADVNEYQATHPNANVMADIGSLEGFTMHTAQLEEPDADLQDLQVGTSESEPQMPNTQPVMQPFNAAPQPVAQQTNAQHTAQMPNAQPVAPNQYLGLEGVWARAEAALTALSRHSRSTK